MQSTEMILTILVTVIAVAALIQLVILIALFLAVRKGMGLAGKFAQDIGSEVVPLLQQSKKLQETARDLISNLAPKLESAATDLAAIAHIASAEAKRLQESTDEITDRVRRQAARVDEMATDALNTVDHVAQVVDQAVSIPLRQVAGVVAAAKAIVDTLRKPAARRAGRG